MKNIESNWNWLELGDCELIDLNKIARVCVYQNVVTLMLDEEREVKSVTCKDSAEARHLYNNIKESLICK